MLVHGLRLLVALITFAVGVAASALLGSGQTEGIKINVTRPKPVLVAAPSLGESAPPQPGACYFKQMTPVVVEGGMLNGKAVSKPAPAYPQDARDAGLTGTVVVRVEVGEGGGVESAEAVSGPSALREAAVGAALRARFTPTRLSGQPVRVSGYVTYNFGLR